MFDKIIDVFDWALKDISTKFTFYLFAPIEWPDRCVVCEKNPAEYNILFGRALKGKLRGPDFLAFLFFSSEMKIVISVPVCRRHSFQMDYIRFLSFWSFVAIPLFVILTFASFFDLEMQSPYFHAMVYFFLSIFFIVIFIFSLRRQPVRLKEVGDIFFTIVIKDKDYAKEFASINACYY